MYSVYSKRGSEVKYVDVKVLMISTIIHTLNETFLNIDFIT